MQIFLIKPAQHKHNFELNFKNTYIHTQKSIISLQNNYYVALRMVHILLIIYAENKC